MNSVDDVFQFVRDKYGYSKGSLLGKSRGRDIVTARHIAMFLIVEKCGLSYPQTGKVFHKDHSTVMSAHQKIRGLILDGRLDLDEKITGYEPTVRHAVKLDETIDGALDLIRQKIDRAFQRDPLDTIQELIDLAKRLDAKHGEPSNV